MELRKLSVFSATLGWLAFGLTAVVGQVSAPLVPFEFQGSSLPFSSMTPFEGGDFHSLMLTTVNGGDPDDYNHTVAFVNRVHSVTSLTAVAALGTQTVETPAELGQSEVDPIELVSAAVELSAPSIVTEPASQTAIAGLTVVFNVEAEGADPLWYQWFKDGTALEPGSLDSLVLVEVNESDGGEYTVLVGNEVGSVLSAAAVLTVVPDVRQAPVITTQPLSQAVEPGGSVTFTVAATGTEPLTYQWFKDGAEIEGASSDWLDVAAVTASDAGDYSVLVGNEVDSIISEPAALTVASEGPEAPQIIRQPEGHSVTTGETIVFTVEAIGAEPISFQWAKDGIAIDGANSPSLVISPVEESDAGDYLVVVSNEVDATTSHAAALVVTTGAMGVPLIKRQPESQTAAVGETAVFTVLATGAEPMTYLWSKDGSKIEGAHSESLVIGEVSEKDAGNYTVAIHNDIDSVTSLPATLTVTTDESEAPVITSQPQSLTVAEGETATFSVSATGAEPLAYQWLRNGTEIHGAHGSSLVISDVSDSDAGDYVVMVSNEIDTVTSQAATLTITESEREAPVITTQPASLTTAPGTTVTLTVAATGTDPLTYQWFRDGVEIEGATAATLILVEVDAMDAGEYTVVVHNEVDSVTSDPATLMVASPRDPAPGNYESA